MAADTLSAAVDSSSALLARWRNNVVFEVAGAVRLRPQANPTLDGRTQYRIILRIHVFVWSCAISSRPRFAPQRVIERERSIQPRFERSAVDSHLQIMPRTLVQHERLVAIAELHWTPPPIVKLP